MRIGLVLGAGGATGGAFHAAVLSTLADATGWDPRTAEVVVGTSAGSITGSMLRAGVPAADLAAAAKDRQLSAEAARALRPRSGANRIRRTAPSDGPPPPRTVLRRAALRPWTVRPGVVAAALLPPGRVSTDIISDRIGDVFGETWPDRPLWVVAVHLESGRRVVFGRDARPPVGLAVEASCSIPGYFSPVEIEGRRYVDGGVHSPTNLDLLAGERLDLVVVSSPMTSAGRRLPRTADVAVRRYSRLALDTEARRVRRAGTPVIAFQPTGEDLAVMGLNAMDWNRRGAVFDAVRSSTLRRLERPDVGERLAPLGLR